MIEATIHFVKNELQNAESGHDWWHTYRVWKTAEKISLNEPCNRLVVALGALLHDISDAKLNGGNENKAPEMAQTFLKSIGVDPDTIAQVLYIIKHISFRNNLEQSAILTPELAIVMDADRLDAMGAIGIARTFNYGGFKHRAMYNPDLKTEEASDYKSYTASESPTINHFYNKLLKLKDLMNTPTGKLMAQERHDFMVNYLKQFYKEWEGE